MKNFWLERAEKKEAAAMEQSIDKILDAYFSYVITPLTMDACDLGSTITVSIGYYISIGTVDSTTGFVYTDSSFQKESERVEAQGWVLDV